MHPNPRRVVPVVVVVLAVIGGIWWWSSQAAAGNGRITASGTIEATELRIGSELSGRIAAVGVAEGDPVTAEQPLVMLDRALLEAQREQAAAAYVAAQKAATAAEMNMRLENSRVGSLLESQEAAQAQAEAAQAQAESVRAALRALDVQLAKTIITTPINGTVLERAIEPGEMALPGGTLLVIADLDRLKITVYIPEDRYGQIALGGVATVTVDSFPGQAFSATVTRIADKAEFTPRNVQTVEGRKSTVFAVTLTIDNPDGKLKPGMPADVAF